jgi:hypothetical protein
LARPAAVSPTVAELNVDLLIAGPAQRLGIEGGGTPA